MRHVAFAHSACQLRSMSGVQQTLKENKNCNCPAHFWQNAKRPANGACQQWPHLVHCSFAPVFLACSRACFCCIPGSANKESTHMAWSWVLDFSVRLVCSVLRISFLFVFSVLFLVWCVCVCVCVGMEVCVSRVACQPMFL